MAEEQLLLDAIRADPDQLDNYLVYGDWLSERGDPRGELIGLSYALAQDPENPKLARRVNKLVKAQLAALPSKVDAIWKLGFISELRIDIWNKWNAPELRALFRHPSLQLLEAISAVDRDGFVLTRTSKRHASLLATIVRHAPTTLRRLEIGGASSPLFETIGELQAVLAQFPRLRELAIHAQLLPEGCLEVLVPIARSLELGSAAFTD